MAEIRAPTGLESSVPKVKRKRGAENSDLLVLSVFLKKEQKENDEVAKAIERLRLNGVNCVYFTMDDIRKNGNLRQQEETSSGGSRRTSSGSDVVSNNSEVPSTPLSSQDDEEAHLGRTHLLAQENQTQAIATKNSKKRNWEVANDPGSEASSLISAETHKSVIDQETPPLLPKTFKKKRRKKLYPYRSRPKKKKSVGSTVGSKIESTIGPTVGSTIGSKIESTAGSTVGKGKVDSAIVLPPTLTVMNNSSKNEEEFFPTKKAKGNKGENGSLMVNGDLVNGLVKTVSVALKKNNHNLKSESLSLGKKKDTRIIEVYPARVGKNGKRNAKTLITTIVPEPIIPIVSHVHPEPNLSEKIKIDPKLNEIKIPEIKRHVVKNGAIINSIKNSPVENSAIQNPSVKNSTKQNSSIENTAVKNSAFKNSTIKNSVVKNLEVEFSEAEKAKVVKAEIRVNGAIELGGAIEELKRLKKVIVKKRRKRVSHFNSGKRKKKALKAKAISAIESSADGAEEKTATNCVHEISPIDQVQDKQTTNEDSTQEAQLQSKNPTIPIKSERPENVQENEGNLESQLTQLDKLIKNEETTGIEVKLEVGNSDQLNVSVKEEIQEGKTEIHDEAEKTLPGSEDSLPGDPDAMQLRRSSFYSLISTNVRNNLENHLDGRSSCEKIGKRRKRMKNGFLLHHGDNCPQDPESPYRFHLATQISLKLNKRRVKSRQKEGRGKTLLSYLKLDPKRSSRTGKTTIGNPPVVTPSSSTGAEEGDEKSEEPIFSGEWTQKRKFICKMCGKVEDSFWDIVMHKGEEHPGVVVTHADLPTLPPPTLIYPPIEKPMAQLMLQPPKCSKCSTTFTSFPDLHKHIFECAGSLWLEVEPVRKKKGKRRRGFKRRFSNTPKKQKIPSGLADVNNSPGKVRSSEVFKCEFCTREFKTEGWLKNHIGSHSLLCSIPLEKLTLPSRASFNSSSTLK